MRSDELLDAFEIDPAPIWPADDDRLEPIFLAGPLGIELDESEPLDATPAQRTIEALPLDAFDAFLQLDPERSEEPDEALPVPPRRAATISLFGSLGLHLLVLLGLLAGRNAPAEVSGAIPVQLVIDKPQSATEEAPPTRAVTESSNETAPADRAAGGGAAKPPARPPPNPTAAVTQPLKPRPSQPAPKQVAMISPAEPAPPPSAPAALTANAPTPTPTPNPAPRGVPAPGPDASRGDYLDYLVTLTRGHFDLLPLSFLAGRHGRTILSVLVFEDGTISRVSVRRSSGYPDIDAKIEQMVAAVGRFPPVPNSFRKPSVELDFNMAFPDALQQ